MTPPSPPWRWRRSPRSLMHRRCPDAVRQKLGWLLLDLFASLDRSAACHGAAGRAAMSDWSAKPAQSHVLLLFRNAQSAARDVLNVTFGSSFDGDDTHVGAMLHPGMAAWSAALAVSRARWRVRAGDCGCRRRRLRDCIRIGLAMQPAPFQARFSEHRHMQRSSATAAAAGRLLFGTSAAAGSLMRSGLPAAIASGAGAILLFRRVGQAYPGGACGAERGRGRVADAKRI